MNPTPHRAAPFSAASPAAEPLDLTAEQMTTASGFDEDSWVEQQHEERGAGGRQVLGIGLALLAAVWLAYTAWSAGRALGGQPLSSPAIAQWVAVAAGPLAILGLCWLMFGRTRRKEAERFTQAVISMRAEARSLEGLLQVLVQRISDSRLELTSISSQLMQLGDEATGKLGGITRTFDASTERLKRHAELVDRAAESARNDIAVLLEDLPRAEHAAGAVANHLQTIGLTAGERVAEVQGQVEAIARSTQAADETIGEATDRLAARLAEIELAGSGAAARVGEADALFANTLDALLDRTSNVLDEIRSGIDVQASAVSALVAQASAGLGRAGIESSETLAANVARANETLGSMAGRVAEQERVSQRMIAEIERGLALIDERFSELATRGDDRANHFLQSLTRARNELDSLAAQASTQDSAIESLAERTTSLRSTIAQLADEIRDGAGTALGETQGSAERLVEGLATLRPELEWVRDATAESHVRLYGATEQIVEQQDRLAALLASVDDGVETSRSRLTELASAISAAEREAATLNGETAPALVAALLQVKDAAAHAAERAREAIEAVIPASAGKLSEETRAAIERVLRETVNDQLQSVETVAERAVEAARAASDRLTQQMLSLGQSASALEQHMEQVSKDQREKDSEAFARRVSLLIDSMHSAAIDVGKILSDEVDEKAWGAYLKGNRGVFTRRAVRLLDGSETRAIRAHYESDAEFQNSVNRYVHDFEATLRRVLAERDGGLIAVTMMSSDMGKLYAALAQAIDRRR